MRWFALVLMAGVPALSAAQGFGLYEHGACVMGRAGAGVASPCPDGSAIFFNPAGLVGLDRRRATLGVTAIQATGSFTDDRFIETTDLDNPLIPVPNAYLTYALRENATVGIGLFAPYGLQTRWPTDFDGRFLGYDSKIRSFYVQPTVAFQPHERVKIGIGAAYVYSDLELHQRVDFSAQPVPGLPSGTTFYNLGIPYGTDIADATLMGSGSGYALNIGVIIKVSDVLSIGGRWLTSATVDYDGDAAFTQIQTQLVLPVGHPINLPGVCVPTMPCQIDNLVGAQFPQGPLGANAPFNDGGVHTTITLPAQASLGFVYDAGGGFRIMGEWQYVLWSSFDRLSINFDQATPDFELYEGYRDTHGVRFGMEYDGTKSLTARVGILYHTAAAPDETVTPLLPEAERNEASAGFTWRVSPQVALDVALQYVKQNNRRGRVHDAVVGNTGIYSFGATLFGIGLSFTY